MMTSPPHHVMTSPPHHVIIELFYAGSHKQLIDRLVALLPSPPTLLTLPGKKWHWRARVGPLQLLPQLAALTGPVTTLFTTAVGSLPELVGLCPLLAGARKVLYFHENQLEYPRQGARERDYQYGYNQVMSAIMADLVLFNSNFNMESFLTNIDPFLNKMPDYKPKGVSTLIRKKSRVLYFPVDFPPHPRLPGPSELLHIVWPHRWEHDKNPAGFFTCLETLIEAGCRFKVSVLGASFTEVPEEFEQFRASHGAYIAHWGPLEPHSAYLAHLGQCDVIVSTAQHEYYGVAMLEGVWAGCFPLCPNRLSYPELYPRECLYNTPGQLAKQLRGLCRNPGLARSKWGKVVRVMDFSRYSWEGLKEEYLKLFSQ